MQIPATILTLLAGALLGAFFSTGLGSSALTDVIVNHDGQILGSVVMLDFDAFMDLDANAWATLKENTPFSASSLVRLEVEIADGQDNTRGECDAVFAAARIRPCAYGWQAVPANLVAAAGRDESDRGLRFPAPGLEDRCGQAHRAAVQEDFAERTGIFNYATRAWTTRQCCRRIACCRRRRSRRCKHRPMPSPILPSLASSVCLPKESDKPLSMVGYPLVTLSRYVDLFARAEGAVATSITCQKWDAAR